MRPKRQNVTGGVSDSENGNNRHFNFLVLITILIYSIVNVEIGYEIEPGDYDGKNDVVTYTPVGLSSANGFWTLEV